MWRKYILYCDLKIIIVNFSFLVPKDPPNNMTFQKIPDEVTKFQLTFLPPSQPNGNIQVYQALVYREDDPTAVQIHNLSIIQKTDTSVIAVLEGLKGGHTYNISVSSRSLALPSQFVKSALWNMSAYHISAFFLIKYSKYY